MLLEWFMAVRIALVVVALLVIKRVTDFIAVGAIQRSSHNSTAVSEEQLSHVTGVICKRSLPQAVDVYEVQGPLYFNALDKYRGLLSRFTLPKVMILRLPQVMDIDASALHVLVEFRRECEARGTLLLLSEVRPRVLKTLCHSRESEVIGEKSIYRDIDQALERARELLGDCRVGFRHGPSSGNNALTNSAS
jgi:SulP family sulfate permease